MKKYFALILVFSFIFSGCATLFKGNKSGVDFTSDPTGAKVYVNGEDRGTTPVKLKLESNKSYQIEFKKDGFATKSYHISSSVGIGWIVLDCLGSFVPLIVDAATGNWMELDQDYINAALEKK